MSTLTSKVEGGGNVPSISYPGITAECVLGTKNIYEIVWNCGGFSAQLATLNNSETHSQMISFIKNQLESIRKKHSEIIFITDERVYNTQKDRIDGIFSEIFGKENFEILTILDDFSEENPVNGLRMNRTKFSSDEDVIRAIQNRPNAVVVSSIPKSDPRIVNINNQLNEKKLQNNFSARALQLLDLNASKTNQLDIAREAMGYVGLAGNPDELNRIFQENPDDVLVLKGVEGVAGGTDVNFLSNQRQRNAVLNKNIFPVLVYRFIYPAILEHNSGKRYASQFRPIVLSDGRYLGGCLKIPSESLPKELFKSGEATNAFAKQNRTLNTSSGITHSFFIDKNGFPLSGFAFIDKKMNILSAKEAEHFLKDFHLSNTQKSIIGEGIVEAAEPCVQQIPFFQMKTNQILKI